MPQVAPTQNVGSMLRTAKKSTETLESGKSGDQVISEAAAASCEISFRSYCEKAKRHRRSLSSSEGRTGRAHRSRSATPEPDAGADAPVRSRTRLDADGESPCILRSCLSPLSFLPCVPIQNARGLRITCALLPARLSTLPYSYLQPWRTLSGSPFSPAPELLGGNTLHRPSRSNTEVDVLS